MMKKAFIYYYYYYFFFLVLVLERLVGLHRTCQLLLLQHQSKGIDLDYSDVE